MLKLMKVGQVENNPSVKLFEGERSLIITGLFGFLISAGIAIFIYFNGPAVEPEGNMKDAFSFNAAIGMFILSIAAILPLARFEARKRKLVRRFFIAASVYSYAIETIQNYRGINPRFSREGMLVDIVAGMLFGVISLVLVSLTLVLMVHFLRIKKPHERLWLILGIRYAFLSVLAANIAGIWMILLQDRITGGTGNLIVLHGVGFHALQTLILPAWILEMVQINERIKKRLIHTGSIAWLLMIVMIGAQTAMGQSVFEFNTLPIISLILLFIWFGTVCIACRFLMKRSKATTVNAGVLE